MSERSRRVVLVSGLSGAGKASVLRALEDLGYDAVDNPPLEMLEGLVARGDRDLAIGIDARSRGFDSTGVLDALDRLRERTGVKPELVFAWAEEATLLRRYTETRRRHPLSPQGRVVDGIATEEAVTAKLRAAADMVVDTSELPLAGLRTLIEHRFGAHDDAAGHNGLTVSLISFGYPGGLPREADMVFDARFLRNPHYDPVLRPRTGQDPAVAAHVEADPVFAAWFDGLAKLIELVLPRFVQEGKKYATIAIGCTGGRHRSVHTVEKLAARLAGAGWRLTITHRELARVAANAPDEPNPSGAVETRQPPVQAQEA